MGSHSGGGVEAEAAVAHIYNRFQEALKQFLQEEEALNDRCSSVLMYLGYLDSAVSLGAYIDVLKESLVVVPDDNLSRLLGSLDDYLTLRARGMNRQNPEAQRLLEEIKQHSNITAS